MANNFKQGDTVRLKSGGPIMTVTFVDGDDVSTVWFDDSGKQEKSEFPAATLVEDDGTVTGF
jgi:uncharacterized protein YodC (DUF2158 family)